MSEIKREQDPEGGPTPFQLVRQLWKKYEHLRVEDRRMRIKEELQHLNLPEDILNRLLREFA